MSLTAYLRGNAHLSLAEMTSNAEIIKIFILFIVTFFLLYLSFDFISRHLFKKDLFTDRKILYGMYFILPITLIAYSVYGLLPDKYPSFWYHLMIISLPLGLFRFGGEKIENFGFKKGNLKYGLLFIGFTLASMSIIVLLKVNIYNKIMTLNPDIFSFLFFDAIILAPLIEEPFMRYFQDKITYINDFLAIFFVAAIGTFIHIPRILQSPEFPQFVLPFLPTDPFGHIIQIFLLQVYLALIYDYTESVYFSIICHIILNIGSLLFLF